MLNQSYSYGDDEPPRDANLQSKQNISKAEAPVSQTTNNHATNPVIPGADNQGPLEAAAEAQDNANQNGNTGQYWQAPSNEMQNNYDQNNMQNYQNNQNQNNGTGNNGYYGENFVDNNQNHNHGYQNQSHAHEDSEYTPAIKEDG